MKLLVLASLCVAAVLAHPVDEDIAPQFNPVADTHFRVFTRFNPTIGQLVNFRNMGSFATTNFLPSRPTRVLIHGWNG